MSWLEDYATQALDGVACKRIKQVCERLLTAMYDTSGEFHFDEQLANRPIEFIERFCKQSEGKLGEPIRLQLFQKAILQSIFGFVDDEDLRQYNEALIICGRKNGKTTLLSALELFMLVADGEGSPEVYNIATKRDQALKGYVAAKNMVLQSPDLSKHIKRRQSDLYFPTNLGKIQPLASNTNGLDGLNGHCIVIDELAAIKNRDIYDLMKQSMSARSQPLLFCITTNGFIREGIFDAQYDYACGVLDGKIDNPRFLPFIYELDKREEWIDENAWLKANPGIDAIKSRAFLRECVNKGKSDLSFRPTVLVKDFNLKQTGESAWLRWEELNNDEEVPDGGWYAFGGFDAADSIDLNAAKVVFVKPGDPRIYVKSMYWLPEEQIRLNEATGSRQERDNMPYDIWNKRGLLRTVEGNRVPRSVFLDWFRELRDEHDIYTLKIGYDPWHVEEDLLVQFRAEFGAESMIPVRQGTATLSAPMKDLHAEFSAHHVVYDGNPVDKMCFANTEIKADINGNIQPVKGLDRRKRIDGTVALICAYKVLQDNRQMLEALNDE